MPSADGRWYWEVVSRKHVIARGVAETMWTLAIEAQADEVMRLPNPPTVCWWC